MTEEKDVERNAYGEIIKSGMILGPAPEIRLSPEEQAELHELFLINKHSKESLGPQIAGQPTPDTRP